MYQKNFKNQLNPNLELSIHCIVFSRMLNIYLSNASKGFLGRGIENLKLSGSCKWFLLEGKIENKTEAFFDVAFVYESSVVSC